VTDEEGRLRVLGEGFKHEQALAVELVSRCGDKPDCYLEALGEPASQAMETQFRGIKAAYMVGVLATPEMKSKLIDLMPKLTNPAVRFVAVTVIDHLSPKGDRAVAAQLQAIVDEAELRRDTVMMAANAPIKTVIYRLEARAQ
jgi:hypothetical protein